MTQSRAAAVKTLLGVIYKHGSLTELLRHKRVTNLSDRDQAWVKFICFGALRWHGQLNSLLKTLVKKPLKQKDKDIECLMRIGLFQLVHARTPNHAVVNETAGTAKTIKKPWATALINAVLREFLRKEEMLLADLKAKPAENYAFPQWLNTLFKHDWPENWADICRQASLPPPMTVRVNQQQTNRADYQTLLAEQGIVGQPHPFAKHALILEEACDPKQLPYFAEGFFSVQDAAPQLCAPLLSLKPNLRVLDACAAPGGKTGHLLESEDIDLVAVDMVDKRTKLIHENLDRLKLKATICCADLTETNEWWNGQAFDRILLDAPCSATGVIRRHPDIKLLRRPGDIEQLLQTQQALLETVWGMLAINGILLYATCSILKSENVDQMIAFLERHPEATEIPIETDWGLQQTVGRQILPGEANMDGFYFARIGKRQDS